MQDFLVHSIIASIVLTLLLNIVPRLFPKATQRAERKVHEKMKEAFDDSENGGRPRVKVFFSWKWMILISVILTIVVNLIGLFLHR